MAFTSAYIVSQIPAPPTRFWKVLQWFAPRLFARAKAQITDIDARKKLPEKPHY
jgi:hypothetical protein